MPPCIAKVCTCVAFQHHVIFDSQLWGGCFLGAEASQHDGLHCMTLLPLTDSTLQFFALGVSYITLLVIH